MHRNHGFVLALVETERARVRHIPVGPAFGEEAEPLLFVAEPHHRVIAQRARAVGQFAGDLAAPAGAGRAVEVLGEFGRQRVADGDVVQRGLGFDGDRIPLYAVVFEPGLFADLRRGVAAGGGKFDPVGLGRSDGEAFRRHRLPVDQELGGSQEQLFAEAGDGRRQQRFAPDIGSAGERGFK
ncbi:hypothetical protein SDC9_172263 [bioreactor metagenome]|uniref:Uncharacterized protein n=1 Tax=bioreactor metagenome TaxID=1076179 RepID=A0A645GD75_9ZZZZ